MAENKIKYKMVVIGGSAGSLDVILSIVADLPVYSGASFIIVLHRKNDGDSLLTNLLAYRSGMPVKEVEDKDPILPNHIYIAPADYHLLVEDQNSFSLDSSEKIHFSRPSIDVTFESVAEVFGKQVIAVLLSGANADGAAGIAAVKEIKGFTIAQNPLTAGVGYMPQQAINLHVVDKIADAENIVMVINKMLQ